MVNAKAAVITAVALTVLMGSVPGCYSSSSNSESDSTSASSTSASVTAAPTNGWDSGRGVAPPNDDIFPDTTKARWTTGVQVSAATR